MSKLDLDIAISPNLPSLMPEIWKVRNEYCYSTLNSPQYLRGGFIAQMSLNELIERHQADPSSRYLSLISKHDLVGYARIGLAPSCGDEGLLHALCIRKGASLLIGHRSSADRPSDILMHGVIAEFKKMGASAIRAEICCFPVPNLTSMQLHQRHGFLPLATGISTIVSQQETAYMLTFGRDVDAPLAPA